jgi:hypothetical protein
MSEKIDRAVVIDEAYTACTPQIDAGASDSHRY